MKKLNKYWLLTCMLMVLAFSSMPSFAAAVPSLQLKVDQKASKLKVELKDVPSGTSSLQLHLTLEGANGYQSAIWPSNLENDYKYIHFNPNENIQELTLYMVSCTALPENVDLTLSLSSISSSIKAKDLTHIKYLDETLKENTLTDILATIIYGSLDDTSNGGNNNNNNNNNNNRPNTGGGTTSKPDKDKEEITKPIDPVTPESNTNLIDVSFADTSSHWAESSILRMASKGLLTGYPDGTFKPSATTTRNEFATIIAKSFELEPLGTPVPFSDVKEDAWYTDSVMALYERGIITGLAPRNFGGGGSMSNEQMIVILYRTLQHLNISLPSERTYLSFIDENQISPYALEAVKALYEAGLVNGLEGHTFGPKILATRAQVATVLDRVLTLIESK